MSNPGTKTGTATGTGGGGAGGGGGGGNGGETGREEFQMCENCMGKPNGNMTKSDEIEKFFESLPYYVPICDHCKTQYNFSVMQLPVDMIKSE
ncbi:hypothetical protein Phum_PHUM220520 [Pediculus humanus corporis]|uniref:Uncharacterized protein n=1 Tax=Pediculus humanus subsp. corporis TaxID=121224 RepID=E0VI35_PEDHC|nr:uncharacterized protein Phum_PHUM220520 [Pediculus humanus corporis]EEB13041.1 hypothetical protein Phum_PHUM220520 [Pediculus humanus corporis]